jgi:hypothetical protein
VLCGNKDSLHIKGDWPFKSHQISAVCFEQIYAIMILFAEHKMQIFILQNSDRLLTAAYSGHDLYAWGLHEI